MIQQYTSKMTSVNSKKLPAIYNKINWELMRQQKFKGIHPMVLDYGCGRFPEIIEQKMSAMGWHWYGHDPYWSPMVLKDRHFDVIICSNVLNVIKETEIVHEIHDYLREHSDLYFITVYSKTGMSIGHESKPGCWQRDEPLANYMYHDEIIRKNILTRDGEMFII